jgi:hypothetical protein
VQCRRIDDVPVISREQIQQRLTGDVVGQKVDAAVGKGKGSVVERNARKPQRVQLWRGADGDVLGCGLWDV